MALARVPPLAAMRSGDPDDPRARRTRAALLAEYERQLGVDPMGPTVTSVLRGARVSRTAFYAHFASLEALRTAAVADVLAEFGSQPGAIHAVNPAGRGALPYERLFEHIAEHRPLFTNTWATTEDPSGQLRAALVAQLTDAIRAAVGRPADVESSRAAAFVVGGVLACLVEWLDHPSACTARDLARQMTALMPGWLVDDPDHHPTVEVSPTDGR